MTSAANDNQLQRQKVSKHACPICGKPESQADRPFCSPRCKDVDLNRWLGGRYHIPARAIEDEDEE